MTLTNIIVTLTFLVGFSNCQIDISFYRESYVRLGKAFYKYHGQDDVGSWYKAKQTCENEGATLFYPENNDEELNMLREYLKPIVSKSQRFLHIGAIDVNGNGVIMTVDNHPFTERIEHSYMKDGTPMCMALRYPGMTIVSHQCGWLTNYICKVPVDSLRWNSDCNITDTNKNKYEYEYSSKLEKCYKLHASPTTWREAVEICKFEQSVLTVLNSQAEADHLTKLVAKVPEEDVGAVCLGFKLTDEGWITLSGNRLHESGYAMWAHTQPDGGQKEAYGAMAYNGRLHDIKADALCIFVCERNVRKDIPH